MESLTPEEVFSRLRQDPDNNKCVDCRMDEPNWASVNNGVFICNLCAEQHRKLGTSVSFVRSVNLDSWPQSYLALMSLGGNKKFADFMDVYGLNSFEIEEKYPTVAGKFYRKQLKAAANNEELSENAPRVQEGGVVLDRTKGEQEEFVEDSAMGKVKHAFNAFGRKVEESAKKFSEKPKVKSLQEKTVGFLSRFENKINTMVQKTKESQAYQKVKTKSKAAYDSVKESAIKTFVKSKVEDPSKA